MSESYEDLSKQRFIWIVKGEDEESKQRLRRLLRQVVFNSVGLSVSFNEWYDVVIHFGPRFFNQNTFMYGSRFNRRLNNSQIERFCKVVENLSSSYQFIVQPKKPSITNLNMEMSFDFPWNTNVIESSEMTVGEAIEYLKEQWVKLRNDLICYFPKLRI